MPFSKEATIITHGGYDYWRTWFIEECEKAGLFGMNEKHLDIVRHPKIGYSKGTRIFLEDAPYFKKHGREHRVCGPYEIIPVIPTEGSEVVHTRAGHIIVYREANPENGPWLDRSVSRIIDDTKVTFKQLASEFGFFPYRFGIRRASTFQVQKIEHRGVCWLCD